ncbi:MAG TPA: Hpt domain-containing protein, partial [Spirochaetia bacterium]
MALAGIDETRLRRAFLEEAEDLGQKLGERLLALESDLGNRDVVNEVFRLTHSLKSESALMGFTTLSELAHRMEDVLGLARDGRLVLERSTMDGLLAGSDLIGEMMTAIGKGQSDSDFDTARQLADLTVAMGGQASKTVAAPGENAAGARPPHAEAAQAGPAPATESPVLGELTRLQLAEARDRGETAYRLVIGVDEGEPMKFPRAFLVCSNLEATANVVASDPPMDGAPADDAPYARTTILVTTDGGEAVLRRAASVDQVTVIQVDACAWDTLLAAPPTRPPTAAQAGTPAGAAAQGGAVAPSEEQAHRAGPVEKTSIRVETRKLDDLWSYVAELVLHKSHIARLTDSLGKGVDVETAKEELTESFDALEKISSGMQQAMMDTRMIPISVIFSKFPRLVRDLSR